MLTKTSLVVKERVSKVEIAVGGTIVELYSHCVVGVLVNRPDKAS